MIRRRVSIALIALAASLLTACGTDQPADPDGALLTGFATLPKALATIALSATPDPAILEATRIAQQPTPTYAPPTFTPTPTPYVGIFMGQITPPAGTLIYPPGGYRVNTGGAGAVGEPIPFATAGALVPPVGTPPLATRPPGANVPACSAQPAQPFVNTTSNAAIRARVGCPSGEAFGVRLVAQPFQNGYMFWRDTREVFAVSTAAVAAQGLDIYWRVADSWSEGMPAEDGSFVPPAGFLQPVRGFGLIWRTNQGIRDRLGWATAPEQPFDATYQPFERGWMMTGLDGRVFVMVPNGDPATGTHFGALAP